MSYSDHEGVTAIINVENIQGGQGDNKLSNFSKSLVNPGERKEAVTAAVSLIEKAQLSTNRDQKVYSVLAMVTFLLFMATFSQLLLTDRYSYTVPLLSTNFVTFEACCWSASCSC